MRLFDLHGKRALMTGSSRGLGLSIARGLGDAGAELILNGRNRERLQKTVANLAEGGMNAHGKSFDVTQRNDVEAAIKSIEDDIGPIDVLVNNAGIHDRAPLEELVGTAVFPASEASDYINGQIIYVDGCILTAV